MWAHIRQMSERFRRILGALSVSAVGTAAQSIVLRDERSPTNWRSLSASFGTEGDLIIEGHDLGKGVESLFGYNEYEWSLTVAAIDTPKLMAALNDGHGLVARMRHHRHLLDALLHRFSGGNADELESFLKENGVPYSFWNRVGD